MNMDYALIIVEWFIVIGLLIKFIPRNKVREAFVAFAFKQLITWILGLSVVEMGLIEYPVRFFPQANKTSFTFEYFAYPAICAIFNVNFTKSKSLYKRFLYYFYYCTSMTIIEVIVEKYTSIITYIHWSWFTTWISLFVTFYMTRIFYKWFYRLNQSDLF